MTRAELLVIGAGVVGLTIARAWKLRHPGDRVVVLDKEAAVGAHASGRNSGVLHAGLYYAPGSLKARFARDGNRELAAWCDANGVPVRRCGKLIVARSEADHAGLDELLRRARGNGVPLDAIDADAARDIEPRARTVGRALFAPETAAVDPRAVMAALAREAHGLGIVVRLGEGFVARDGTAVRTAAGGVDAGFIVNAAGLHADRIARAWGFSERHAILPFKGLYLYGSDAAPALRCHVYPVPDLDLPFLGVHFTATVGGGVKIGPTALPALWREQYGGLRGFSARDLVEVGWRGGRKLATDPSFRALAARELPHVLRSRMLGEAGALVPGLDPAHWTRWGPPGIRAQLVDVDTGALVQDFVVEGDDRSLHVLNAVSPAFTCSFPFAAWCCDRIEGARG